MEPRQRPLPEWINPGSASPAGGTLRPASTGVPGAPAAAPGGLPEQFGRYRVLKKLGQGAMGAVYLAQDTHLDRPVALKVSAFTAADNPKTLERFHREARAAAQFHTTPPLMGPSIGPGSTARPGPPPSSTTPTCAPSMTSARSMASTI